MKVLIVGGGFAGCCVARLLKNSGHHPIIFESSSRLGGLAKSYKKEGMTYEFGPHILANHNCGASTIKFIKEYIDVSETTMESSTFLQGRYLNYPPNIKDVKYLAERDQIKTELNSLNEANPDESNFENYLISKIGLTLYKLYYKSFTGKFWQVDPKTLSADWAKIRHLGESLTDEKMFFNKRWCAYPKNDFNELFHNLTQHVEVIRNCKIENVDIDSTEVRDESGVTHTGDFIVSTLSIDTLFDYAYGELAYTGYDIEPIIYNKDYCHPQNPRTGNHYSMVYYPEEDKKYTRSTEYKCFNNKAAQDSYRGRTIVTFETPSRESRFYPFMDEKNEELFQKYLKRIASFGNVCSLGRMGLYKYQTIDTTAEQTMKFLKELREWERMTTQQRMDAYLRMRNT